MSGAMKKREKKARLLIPEGGGVKKAGTPSTVGLYHLSMHRIKQAGYCKCPPHENDYIKYTNTRANTNTDDLTWIEYTNNDDGAYVLSMDMPFYFFGVNYVTPDTSIYITTNGIIGFSNVNAVSTLQSIYDYYDWPVSKPAILFDFYDRYNFSSYVSPQSEVVINGETFYYIRILFQGTDFDSYDLYNDETVKLSYEMLLIRNSKYQYVQFNIAVNTANRTDYNWDTTETYANGSNLTDGTTFLNPFGSFGKYTRPPTLLDGPQTGRSYVLRSSLDGRDWKFFTNAHVL
jgi:hypothetical protein